MLKAAAGGGGKGMRVVRAPGELAAAYRARARRGRRRRSATTRSTCEKFVERPRHVEIQVMGDLHGNVVSLGERECSLQRRHQKVVEEAPSTVVTPELRRRMGEAAVAAARAVGYANAGTCEFLLDRRRRLLLPGDEHAPPGRAPGDRDGDRPRPGAWRSSASRRASRSAGVRRRRAARPRHRGPPLRRGPVPRASRPRRAASSCCAAAGARRAQRRRRLRRLARSRSTTTRCSPSSIVWGATASEALRRLGRALAELRIEGIRDQRAALRGAARPTPTSAPRASTSTGSTASSRRASSRRPGARPGAGPADRRRGDRAVRARAARGGGRRGRRGRRSGARAGARAARRESTRRPRVELVARAGGRTEKVTVERDAATSYGSSSASAPTRSTARALGPFVKSLLVDGESHEAAVFRKGERPLDGRLARRRVPRSSSWRRSPTSPSRRAARAARRGKLVIAAYMPGRVVAASGRRGRRRRAPASALVVLEAMKMQNEIQADRAGVVQRVYVAARPGGRGRRPAGRARVGRRRFGPPLALASAAVRVVHRGNGRRDRPLSPRARTACRLADCRVHGGADARAAAAGARARHRAPGHEPPALAALGRRLDPGRRHARVGAALAPGLARGDGDDLRLLLAQDLDPAVDDPPSRRAAVGS